MPDFLPQIASTPQGVRTESIPDAVGGFIKLRMLFLHIVEQLPLRKLRTVNFTDAHSQQTDRQMPFR